MRYLLSDDIFKDRKNSLRSVFFFFSKSMSWKTLTSEQCLIFLIFDHSQSYRELLLIDYLRIDLHVSSKTIRKAIIHDLRQLD